MPVDNDHPAEVEADDSSEPGLATLTTSPMLNKVTSFVRVRPLPRENLGGIRDPRALSVVEPHESDGAGVTESVVLRDHRERDRIFKLDMALGEKATQSDVFNRCGKQLVDCLLSTSGDGSSGGCDGVVLCYGGSGMGKRHTLYETSTSSRLKDFDEDEWEWSYTNAMRGRGRGKDETGLLVRVVHDVFRRKAWSKFRAQKELNSSLQREGSPSRYPTPMATSPPASVAPGLSELELQCSSFSVTHTGLVVDLLGESPCSTPAQDVHEELVESLRTPNFKRTKAGADEREKRKQMDNVKWETCTNTVDFEALLKPAIALCAKHKEDMEQEISENSIKGKDKKADYSPSKEWLRKKSERIQFVVTQLRLVGHGGSHSREGIAASCAPYVSKIAFVLVLPSETLSMEGPVLTGTHLSASMLRLRAVLDALTGIGGKSQALLRANASLATMLAAPLGSTRTMLGEDRGKEFSKASSSKGGEKSPFVCLIGCVSPARSQVNHVSGFLSFAERARTAKLLHVPATRTAPQGTRALQISTSAASVLFPTPSPVKKGQSPASKPTPGSLKTPELFAAGVVRSLAPTAEGISVEFATPESKQTITNANATSAGSGSALGSVMARAAKEGNTSIVPMATPPSARAVSKLVWPGASPATFDAGLSDFAHIKEELETIWTAMREAERYHDEALATAEVELQEAEAATRRAGARATEMRKIITSLRAEIETQKASGARLSEVTANTSGGGDLERLRSLEIEVRRLKEQVKDEQILRREAEAALASLDDECALLSEKNENLRRSLREGSDKVSKKSRNARIQCALPAVPTGPAAQDTGFPGVDLEFETATEWDEQADGSGGIQGESSEATIGDVIGSPPGTPNSKFGRPGRESADVSDSGTTEEMASPPSANFFPQDAQSEPTTPTLVAKKVEPQSSDSEVLSREETAERAAEFKNDEVESTHHSLKELPKKKAPKDVVADETVSARRRHSSFQRFRELMGAEEEENPLVLIIAVNMYKGHTEKIQIHKHDSADQIARDFVKTHNLPEVSIKNLEKLINKNLSKNNIRIGRTKTKEQKKGLTAKKSLTEDTETAAREGAQESKLTKKTHRNNTVSSLPNNQLTPEPKPRTPPTPSSAVSDSGSARPLRPMDMYRFIEIGPTSR